MTIIHQNTIVHWCPLRGLPWNLAQYHWTDFSPEGVAKVSFWCVRWSWVLRKFMHCCDVLQPRIYPIPIKYVSFNAFRIISHPFNAFNLQHVQVVLLYSPLWIQGLLHGLLWPFYGADGVAFRRRNLQLFNSLFLGRMKLKHPPFVWRFQCLSLVKDA